ncbi:LysR substrate-binding domain-containing protein [Methylobacterium brachythecii]|uniref:DNA-binding transcriptional LysR family regulator n=1 Tax=Methylobacterium brachythecii TaxID=1176177 RepID=A0A7W6AJ59_9HYPH|nr:LysR substrate-binding domain-containing protein [Methylobacterium brachythecii]MBB3903643.1 DNA-binding transcriptional LysR family regulator [Methylobacterium brachythecii]GLS44212.1 hypothetical protein GCM10007884_22000 [Methylobacterium brachythecii]
MNNPQGRFRADNAYVLAEAAAAGIGIVAMGEMIAEPYANAGRLVRVMTRYALPAVGIFVVRSPSQHVPRKVRVLVDLLLEMFSTRFPAGLDASEDDPKS